MKFATSSKKPARILPTTRLALEGLEERLTPYSVSGNAWPVPARISISFVPDGTQLGGAASNLFSTFNARFGSSAVWQNQILKAAQVWAQQTNINFTVVSDNGADIGAGSYQQGDPDFGDIRIGGYDFGNSTLAQAYLPPPVNNYSVAGDIQFNTAQTWNVGSTYDLYTVAMHEFGHALGLYHTTTTGTAMYGAYQAVLTGLAADDINGIRNVYSANAARGKDSYDTSASNETSSTASTITSAINTTTKAGVINNLNLTTSTDVDWYKFVVPSGSSSTLKVTARSLGVSLLNPKVELYNSSLTLLGSNAAGTYGGSATVTRAGVASGQTYYVKVTSTDAVAAFKTGRYGLILNMGTGADPVLTPVDSQRAAGTPRTSGGGEAVVVGLADTLVNNPSDTLQQTSTNGHRSVGGDAAGNYVITWASEAADGSGWDVYARRYDANGQPLGAGFRVNTTTANAQTMPTIAMNAAGMFVIAWTSAGQDGSGLGVYAQRFNSAGQAVGSEFQVNSSTAGDQTDASIGIDAEGNFVITWASSTPGGYGSDILAQRFASTGAPIGGDFQVNSYSPGDQTDPSIGMDALGNFTIAWTSAGQDGSGTGIYAKSFTLLGILNLGLEIRVNSTTYGDQRDSTVCVDSAGNFTIGWSGQSLTEAGYDIYAQQFVGLLGLPVIGEIRCNTYTQGNQIEPSAAADSAGNIFMSWSAVRATGLNWAVRGQLLAATTGTPKGNEINLSSVKVGDQNTSSVFISNLGHGVVVWSGAGVEDSHGVYFQRFDLTRDSLHAEDDHDSHHEAAAEAESAPRLSAVTALASERASLPALAGSLGFSAGASFVLGTLGLVEKQVPAGKGDGTPRIATARWGLASAGAEVQAAAAVGVSAEESGEDSTDAVFTTFELFPA